MNNKVMILVVIGFIMLCCSIVHAQDMRKLAHGSTYQRGFAIDFTVAGYRETIYDNFNYFLQGKVSNDYHRTVSSILIYFSVDGSGGDPGGQYVVYLYNLGPQEAKEFTQQIWNWNNLRLYKMIFTLSDGAMEEVRL